MRKPKLAILDEATSALDLGTETAMYTACLLACLLACYTALGNIDGLTYVSVGHRPSLLRFHASRLRLFGVEQMPSYAVEVIETLIP